MFLGSYLFHSPMIYWIVAALSLTIVIDLCFMLLLECVTRSHPGKDVLEGKWEGRMRREEGGRSGKGRGAGREGGGKRGRNREVEGLG